MIFASEDQPNASPHRNSSPKPGELISNLSIEISVFKAIWLSDCPRWPGVGGSLHRYRIEFGDNDPAGALSRKRSKVEQSEHIELARRRNSKAFNNITRPGQNAGSDNSLRVSSLSFIFSKFFGERRNPFRAGRLGLRGGVIFFCRVTAAIKMNLSDTFHRHAQDCQRMAASARHSVDKATWSQMARRCLACAEHYENQQAALDRARDHNRRTHRRWAQTRGSDLAHQQ
jgi:hypothetical protein